MLVDQRGFDLVDVPLAVQQRAAVQHSQGGLLVQLLPEKKKYIVRKHQRKKVEKKKEVKNGLTRY